MSLKLGQSIQYESKDLEASSYSLMKIVPLSGGQTATDGNDVTFEIPVQSINFARSYFYADVSIAAQGATALWKHEGICPFSSMQIFTRGGQYLLNLQERATEYSRIMISSDSHHKDLVSGDRGREVQASGAGLDPLYRSESGASAALGNNGAHLAEAAGVSTAAPFHEQQYTRSGTAAAALVYRIIFPMKMMRDTILAVDKSILYREVLVCKFKLAPGTDIAFAATDAVDPTTGNVALTSAITYSNMAFYVAQERNASVVEALNAQTESESGFSLLVPYPSTFTNSRAAQVNQNVTLRLNKSHGSSLKAIKHCVFSEVDPTNTGRYDRQNAASAKIVSYYTNVNNNRLTEFNIVTAADEDWLIHKKKLVNSPLVNNTVYKSNWYHEDRFDDYQDKLSDLMTEDTNVLSGINLNEEIRWDFFGTTAGNALRHFSIVHGQKLMNINNRGLVLG